MENCKDERLKFEKCEANSGEAPAEQGGVPQETSESVGLKLIGGTYARSGVGCLDDDEGTICANFQSQCVTYFEAF